MSESVTIQDTRMRIKDIPIGVYFKERISCLSKVIRRDKEKMDVIEFRSDYGDVYGYLLKLDDPMASKKVTVIPSDKITINIEIGE